MDDRTRRDWLITIGQTAATFGIASHLDLNAASDTSLPPGVYLPSSNHLSHALMSAERFHPVPQGCPTDYIQPTDPAFKPAFFTMSEFSLMQRLTQLLLDEYNVAVSDEIAEWIDLRVASAPGIRNGIGQLQPLHHLLAVAYFGPGQLPEGQKTDGPVICREGLKWIMDTARAQHGAEFLSLGLDQQVAILETIDDQRRDKRENAGTHFFTFLKGEVIRGFYTSQTGLKELDFKGNAFYARSPGCSAN